METFLRMAKQAGKALKDLLVRFLKNQARNDYEEILFNAVKTVFLRYGRA